MECNYVSHMGDDDLVVNAARVSFSKQAENYTPEQNARLIKYLARHGHWCYDDQTEVLTDRGWIYFNKLQDNDRVAQVDVNNNTMSFVVPEKVHRCEYSGPMYYANSGTVNYCVTPGHKMWYQKRTKEGYGKFIETTSDEAFGLHHKRFRTTANLRQDGEGTFSEGWVVGFLLGDGFIYGNHVNVRLKRERKISALEKHLKKTGIPFSRIDNSAGVTAFSVEIDTSFMAKCIEKKIPDIRNKSHQYIEGMFYGLMESDGSVKHGGWAFSSSSLQLFEDVEYLATLCGFSFSRGRPRNTDNPNWNTNFRGNVLSRHCGNVKRHHESIHSYVGMVYCVTVPTGYIMVRRKGKQMVCGNTPFGHPQVCLHLKAPIFVARQLGKSQVGFVWNEVSRRYVDTAPEFYVPGKWRLRAENAKQGSSDEEVPSSKMVAQQVQDLCHTAAELYRSLVEDMHVAPEMARMVLPQNTVTEWYWTGSLAAWARVYHLRSEKSAQQEVRWVAEKIDFIMEGLFPVSWAALRGEEHATEN